MTSRQGTSIQIIIDSRYEYTITTQFHLKDWAKADNDLMLCYKTDSDTKFVLGCTKAE